jgi:hypothetical protein
MLNLFKKKLVKKDIDFTYYHKNFKKIFGNIPKKKLDEIEQEFESLGNKYSYPTNDVAEIFIWLWKNYPLSKDSYLLPLEKVIKTAKVLGRRKLILGKKDLVGII